MSVPHADPGDDPSGQALNADARLIYEAAWRKAETFFEWRHKVMTFSVSVVGAGIVAAGWLLNNDSVRVIVGALLVLGGPRPSVQLL
ncbi:MAG: hypothetical protein WKF96_17745 [Solirubrobacteraceae bacterium]